MTRDYVGELRVVIDKAMEDGGVAGQIAAQIVDDLRQHDPELLDGWLQQQAVQFMREFIGSVNRAVRSRARTQGPRSVFGEAASRADHGDAEALEPFLTVQYVVDPEHTRKRLLDMTRDHLLYAATDYDDRARSNGLEAAFLRALAKKVGGGVVADHFTPEQLSNMRTSLYAA